MADDTKPIPAYSDTTGKHYDSWDDLVAAETNGYVVVAISDQPGTVPFVTGPYTDKAETRRAQARVRRKAKKDRYGDPHPYRVRAYVRHLWKERP